MVVRVGRARSPPLRRSTAPPPPHSPHRMRASPATLARARRYTTFKAAIQNFGLTVMILSPFEDPVPLTRSWCLWEIYCTLEAPGCVFEVALPEAQQAAFEVALHADLSSIKGPIQGKPETQIRIARVRAASPAPP